MYYIGYYFQDLQSFTENFTIFVVNIQFLNTTNNIIVFTYQVPTCKLPLNGLLNLI